MHRVKEDLLFCSGSVKVADNVWRAMLKSKGHREKEFSKLIISLSDKLLKIYQIGDKSKYYSVIITGSRMTANKPVLSLMIGAKNILFLINEEFWERIYNISKVYNKHTHELSPVIKSDEALKSSLTVNYARAAKAAFINQDELNPLQNKFQNRLNKNFYYPTENVSPKSRIVNSSTIFTLSKKQKQQDEFLRSGAVYGTIVARQEEQTIAGVIDYAKWRLGDPERVLVMIAPPPTGEETDKSYHIAKQSGVMTIHQERVMQCIDRRQAEKKLGVPYPFPEGKGTTMMCANIVRFLVEPQRLPKPNELKLLAVIDADVHNPADFDVWGFIGEAAFHDTQERLQYRAARDGRNNEIVKAGINLLPMYDNNKINYFYNELSRDQWILTGQHMSHPLAEWYRMQPSGYSLEVGTNMHQTDLMRDKKRNPHGLDRVQVAIPTNCFDAGNDDAKEQGIQYMANIFIHTIAKHRILSKIPGN